MRQLKAIIYSVTQAANVYISQTLKNEIAQSSISLTAHKCLSCRHIHLLSYLYIK